jgi:hypothetical protein
MALVNGAVVITYTVVDSNNNKSTVSFKLPAGTLGVEVNAVEAVLRPALLGIIEGALAGYTISYPVVEDALVLPPLGVEVERKGIFRFEMTNLARGNVEVPAISSAVFVPQTDVIDPNNAAVGTFVAAIRDDGVADTTPVDAAGRFFVRYIDGYKYHRRSGTSRGIRRG